MENAGDDGCVKSENDEKIAIITKTPERGIIKELAPKSTPKIIRQKIHRLLKIIDNGDLDDEGRKCEVLAIIDDSPALQSVFYDNGIVSHEDVLRFSETPDWEKARIVLVSKQSARKYECRHCGQKYQGHCCEATEKRRKKTAEKKAVAAFSNAKKSRDAEKKNIIMRMTKDIVIEEFGLVIAVPQHPNVDIVEDDVNIVNIDVNNDCQDEYDHANVDNNESSDEESEEEAIEEVCDEQVDEIIQSDAIITNISSNSPEYENPVDDIIPELENLSIFDVSNKMSLVSWNTRTLAAMDNPDIPIEQWDEICIEFAKHDIITLTEILPLYSPHNQRLQTFIDMIKKHSKSGWKIITSKPAGPGKSKGKMQIHVMLVKHPIEVIDSKTISVKNIDYSPLVVHVRDIRMNNGIFLGDFVISSIHMPPDRGGKRIERCKQIYKWVGGYKYQSIFRLNRFFKQQQARDAQQSPTIHIMQGDWNEWIGNYSVEISGFDIILSKNVTTSSGGKQYDNFIISCNYANYLNIPSKKVLRFKRFYKSCNGQSGLSDHAPIMFELDVPK